VPREEPPINRPNSLETAIKWHTITLDTSCDLPLGVGSTERFFFPPEDQSFGRSRIKRSSSRKTIKNRVLMQFGKVARAFRP
jgi:hypothetical protein